jgi:nucleoside-diphosphate-sugar epimerase
VDAAEALYLLVNDEGAWNQTWHLPTAQPPRNGEQLIETTAKIIGVKPNKTVFGKTMLSVIGWFVPAIRESMEMLYQFEFPYVFNSDKFNNHFKYTPVSYEEGIRQSIEHVRKTAS